MRTSSSSEHSDVYIDPARTKLRLNRLREELDVAQHLLVMLRHHRRVRRRARHVHILHIVLHITIVVLVIVELAPDDLVLLDADGLRIELEPAGVAPAVRANCLQIAL